MIAALIRSVPKNKKHLVEQESYEYTTTFLPGSLGDGITLHILDDDTPNRLWLNGIESQIPQQGHARAVFKKLCDMADAHKVTLAGNVSAYDVDDPNKRPDSSYPDDTALMAWYYRLGFRVTREPDGPGETVIIERKPVSKSY